MSNEFIDRTKIMEMKLKEKEKMQNIEDVRETKEQETLTRGRG